MIEIEWIRGTYIGRGTYDGYTCVGYNEWPGIEEAVYYIR